VGEREPDRSNLLPSRRDAVDDAASDDEVGFRVVVAENEALPKKPDPRGPSAQGCDASKGSWEAAGAHRPLLSIFCVGVRSFIGWIHALALGLGGPGLFVVAFLDSSFLSLPQINDLLVVLMVVERKDLVLYYAAMATFGSVAGCYAIYYLAEKGGEAFLLKRLKPGHVQRALAAYKRNGLMALMIPALLPPPAPFKLFVLAAGVARVRPAQFVIALTVARGARYVAIGILAVYYGDSALELMRTHGRIVALVIVGMLVAGVGAFWLMRRRARRA
jgi:membrane protein YqaA with SNARE-associated domain